MDRVGKIGSIKEVTSRKDKINVKSRRKREKNGL